MENIIEVEIHPNGTQIYLNDEPYAWLELSTKSSENKKKIDKYAAQFQAQVLFSKVGVVTKHFKIDHNFSLDEWKIFLNQLSKVIVRGEYFRAGLLWTYISFQGIESAREIDTYEDVFHRYRHRIYAKFQLMKKPRPQERWKGEWININELLKAEKLKEKSCN